MKVHLVDGTFELFRCFHGAPRARNAEGREVGAARGFLATMVALLRDPEATHVAVAFDSVVAPAGAVTKRDEASMLSAQAPLAAAAVRALGLTVWPTGRYQADEIIATAAARYADDPAVDQVVICATDNDFAQCVRGERVVVLDRIRKVVTDEAVVRTRFGVAPQQIPDLFALVGDRSDGLPGVPGWGLRSAGAMLARYGTLDAIPDDEADWDVELRGRSRLAASLRTHRREAQLCRDLSELRIDLPLSDRVVDLEWGGADRAAIDALVAVLEDASAAERITRWRH